MARAVMDYESGAELAGVPSPELCAQSDRTAEGAISAYRDTSDIWQYVPEDMIDAERRNGREVITVWVALANTAPTESALYAAIVDEAQRYGARLSDRMVARLAKSLARQDVEFGEIGITAAVLGLLAGLGEPVL